MTQPVSDLTQEARDAIRRLHMDEPVEVTNAHAQSATFLAQQIGYYGSEPAVTAAAAQVQATLALAQEVKNLRLAMYPHPGEAPITS